MMLTRMSVGCSTLIGTEEELVKVIPVESYLMKLQESLVRNGADAEVPAVKSS